MENFKARLSDYNLYSLSGQDHMLQDDETDYIYTHGKKN